jgi:carbon-monoxide dehydrogenase large subunit
MEVLPDGRVDMVIGSQSCGQGHETTFRQIGSEFLGVPFEKIDFRYGDTLFVHDGSGSHSARTMRVGGHLFSQTRDEIIRRGKAIAAHLLECAAEDLQFADGRFVVAGTDRAVGLFDIAARAADPASDLPEALKGPLRAVARIDTPMPAYPNGCHVAEVEIDPDTGVTRIVGYTAVDDFGVVLNPMLVAGQVHGGVVQGIGQALYEHAVYDDAGQLLSGSFMDYCMPRADGVPAMAVSTVEVPCKNNPMGVKGCGEAGSVASPAAVINAIIDALSDLGVHAIDMPATPQKVWQLIRAHSPAAAAE